MIARGHRRGFIEISCIVKVNEKPAMENARLNLVTSFSIPLYELLLERLLSIVPSIVISRTVIGGFTRGSTCRSLTFQNISNRNHYIVDTDIMVEDVVLFKEHHEGCRCC